MADLNPNFANTPQGPVTDYGSSMVQWMRNRQPRYMGGVRMEVERPNPSYVVDVCDHAFQHQHSPMQRS